ncbi:hypothetical protein MRB53_038939 [Persea americana]|nr:hypothetical protein MRB53_038939 [Persea americana]
MELVPLPYEPDEGPKPTTSSSDRGLATGDQHEKPQGLLKIHSLPILNERGSSGVQGEEGGDWAFAVTRRKGMVIFPFSLPPAEGAEGPQTEQAQSSKLEF